MGDLIGLLIQAIIDLLSNRQKTTAPPPKLPPRPPARPTVTAPQVYRPQPPQPARPSAVRQPALRPARAPARPAPPVAAKPPAPVVVAQTAAQVAPPAPRPQVSHVAVDATVLRRWLTPGTLRTQFILTEVFQPPLALRKSAGD
jgi:hypothetical protein